MILPTQKYWVVAYSTDGSIVGLIKSKLNFNDVTKLIPIDYIIKLANENI